MRQVAYAWIVFRFLPHQTDPVISVFSDGQPNAKVQLIRSPLAARLNEFINAAEDVDRLVGNELRQLDREHFL